MNLGLVMNMTSKTNDEKPRSAKKIKRNVFFSLKGSAVQLLGIVLFPVCMLLGFGIDYYLSGNTGAVPPSTPFALLGLFVGFIIMLKMFRVGSRIATKWYCGSCKSLIDNKDVAICPTCKIKLM